ncbi:MAG: hypothetical protein UU21_C0001G0011 [Candidatus Levybacteria bacterium GW2011_GWA2_40_8]|nr:MAG: hypothetical protein UU21_C0001G0011 [Candidatus Levybacteria bacterium GW2011_GWA2_40_8]
MGETGELPIGIAEISKPRAVQLSPRVTTVLENVAPQTEQAKSVAFMQAVLEGHVAKLQEKPEFAANDRIDKTKKYFLSIDERTGLTPFERVARMYDFLDPPTDPEQRKAFDQALKIHMQKLTEWAFDQHFQNPEQYVSHGFDHSINVANFSMQALDNLPEIVGRISEEYGISERGTRFIVQNLAFLHDIGYPLLAEKSSKSIHSATGVELVVNKEFQDALLKLVGPSKEHLMIDFEGAILFHNADVIERAYSAKIITTRGEFLALADDDSIGAVINFYSGSIYGKRLEGRTPSDMKILVKSEEKAEEVRNLLRKALGSHGLQDSQLPNIVVDNSGEGDGKFWGRRVDLEPGDKKIGLEYKPADTLNYSLLAVLRIADGVDMTPQRFSVIQRLPAFKEIYKAFGDGVSPESQLLKLIESAKQIDPVLIQSSMRYLRRVQSEESSVSQTQIHDEFEKTIKVALAQDDPTVGKEILEKGFKAMTIDRILTKYGDLGEEQLRDLRRIGILQNTESFRHFAGCESIVSVSLEPSSAGSQVRIVVDRDKFDALSGYTVREDIYDRYGHRYEEVTNASEYQIWRAFQTVQENYHGGKKIGIEVVDGNDVPVELSFVPLQKAA